MRELYAGSLKQGNAETIFVTILDSLGDPVLGLTDTDITFQYIRTGDTLFNLLPLLGIITEISSGVYKINLDPAVTAYVGVLRILLTGAPFDDVYLRYDVTAGVPGNIQVTLTIEDGVSTPFPEVQVDIWNDAQTLLLWSSVTDINGQVVTALNPGTYKVLLRRNRTVFTIPETLIVTGPSPETQTYTGSELTLVSPTSPDTCIIYGDIYDINGVPDDQMSPESIIITATRSRTPVFTGSRLLTVDPIDVRADQSGHFEITLIRGIQVSVDIPRVQFKKQFTVPDQASENIVNII